ncbi:MAG TPA: MBOAT family O-acyltransferase [Gemmatimonadaceae bacterium]|nr:MBOAT family O-acyltransferase [Gemmatimonadaceae bacterium]
MQLSLLSPGFLGLALVAVVALPVLRGDARQLAFIAINLTFIWAVLLGPASTLGVLLFALLGYGLVHASLAQDRRAALAMLLAGYVALFIYLQRYDFLQWVLPEAALPRFLSTVGLSFLFFKIVHVVIDAASGTLGRLDLLTYLNYCLNFATFAMGPIQRFQDYRAQWDGEQAALPDRFEPHLDATLRILLGLAKVYVLAPFFGDRALQPDTNLAELNLTGFVVQSYAFWIFLFLNFSGYCDAVIGIGSLFGVRPPENFNKPYLARNISDFWQRQHRSLTLWLTDYIFTPLYKKLLSAPRLTGHRLLAANMSLFATMLVSGLWHGTTLSFLLFGVAHGAWFVVYHTWDALLQRRLGRQAVLRLRRNWLVHAGGIFVTFNATAFTFVFFRVSPDALLLALRSMGPA